MHKGVQMKCLFVFYIGCPKKCRMSGTFLKLSIFVWIRNRVPSSPTKDTMMNKQWLPTLEGHWKHMVKQLGKSQEALLL